MHPRCEWFYSSLLRPIRLPRSFWLSSRVDSSICQQSQRQIRLVELHDRCNLGCRRILGARFLHDRTASRRRWEPLIEVRVPSELPQFHPHVWKSPLNRLCKLWPWFYQIDTVVGHLRTCSPIPSQGLLIEQSQSTHSEPRLCSNLKPFSVAETHQKHTIIELITVE